MCGGISLQSAVATESASEKEAVERPALEACMVQRPPHREDSPDSAWTSPSDDEACQALNHQGATIAPACRRPSRPQQLSFLDISRPISLDSQALTFCVQLEKKRPEDKLGLDVDRTNGRTLIVASLREGMASAYNAEVLPEKQIKPGDSIIAVNDVRDDSQAMLKAVASIKLTLVIERPSMQAVGKENTEEFNTAKTPLAALGVGSLRDSEVSPKEMTTPLTSKSHIDQWDTADETLIFFDWDDTLCPTTYIWEDSRLKWNEVAPCFADPSVPGHPPDLAATSPTKAQPSDVNSEKVPMPLTPSSRIGETSRTISSSDVSNLSIAEISDKTMLELLEEHQSAVIALLRLATTLGKVVILTLAEVDWVETSCRNFMPRVLDLLQELDVEVVYARKSLSNRFLKRAHEEENDLTKVLKTRAMSRMIKAFYGTNGKSPRSWKNVLSIGDSTAERSALQDIILRRVQRDRRGEPKECRCKVIKLISEPSVERLTAQVQVLSTWILTIVAQDGDIDIDFEDFDEADDPESPPRRRRSTSGVGAFNDIH